MERMFGTVDFNSTIRDYEFTRIAIQQIHSVVTSEDFADMDVPRIFDFLYREMEMVSFKDYLRRYIYERTELLEPFDRVPDDTYRSIIMDSFAQNSAPHSFTPTTVKWGTMVKRWLEQKNVQRSTILLLGFGLRMSDEDAADFLTTVLKEEGFRLDDPWEAVCWYCFKTGQPYARALELMEEYQAESVRVPLLSSNRVTEDKLRANCTEKNLQIWLAQLKKSKAEEQMAGARRACFDALYRGCQETIAALYRNDALWRDGGEPVDAQDVGPADVERILYDGVPLTKSGNLQKMSKSLLNEQFQQRRITRQRLEELLSGSTQADRFDLITLQFLISSQTEDEDPQRRCRLFLDAANAALERCGMMKMYPVNPYEAFVMMCLLTELPLVSFYDVWQLSYDAQAE